MVRWRRVLGLRVCFWREEATTPLGSGYRRGGGGLRIAHSMAWRGAARPSRHFVEQLRSRPSVDCQHRQRPAQVPYRHSGARRRGSRSLGTGNCASSAAGGKAC
jgi:hypothetical protein